MQLWRQRRLLQRRAALGLSIGLTCANGVIGSAASRAPEHPGHAMVLAQAGLPAWTWWTAMAAATAALCGTFALLQKRALARERERLHQARELELERLASLQARQAKEAADAANHAKSEFLATMSHEIRTPLNGVIGSAELMLETPLNAQQREYMNTVRSSAEALLAIVNDILDFSKIEEGKVVLEHAMFDLRQPVIDVLKIASARIGERDLELVLDFAPDLPVCVYGDAARLRQVLLNLVSNAVKFTPKGHVLVRVTPAERNDAAKTWLKFAVIDTGIGIPAETRVRLFEKFTQADASTTRRFGGTGLGLAISKRLVELMGGEIGLESDPGHGSLFWFTLPLQVDELQVPASKAPASRALVVDDLAAAADAMIGLLRGLNVHGEGASTLDQATAKIEAAKGESRPFDLVFVDHSVFAR
ncbi:MAG TPA: ATP-binding protein, partial [Opitutus sp.]|nr:ATP-binding protein [Opitutus sp.]